MNAVRAKGQVEVAGILPKMPSVTSFASCLILALNASNAT